MIVTCFYTGLINTQFGGRPNSFKRRYLSGITNLQYNTQKKVIYTSNKDYDELFNHINNNVNEKNLERYQIKIFELKNQTFHEKIQSIRKKDGYVQDRCLEIQYGKFQFLLNEKDNDEYLWWVDAGLLDEHLFLKEHVNNLEKYNLFNDVFFENLKKDIKESVYFICGDRHNHYSHGKPDKKFFEKDYQNRYHPVGGFFGGKKELLEDFLTKCNDKIDIILKHNLLYSEEIIMEIIFSENIDDYIFKTFTTWVHKERGVYKRMSNNEKLNFETHNKPYYINFLS